MALWDIIAEELASNTQPRRIRPERLLPRRNVVWDRLNHDPLPELLPPHPRSMTEAREQLKMYLAERDNRIEGLKLFFLDNNVPFETTRDGVALGNQFFAENIYANEEGTNLDPGWQIFAWSYGLVLGDVMIKEATPHRKLRWGVQDVSINKLGEHFRGKTVITGYRYKNSNVEPIRRILDLGAYMLTHKDDDLTANGRFSHPYGRFIDLLDQSIENAKK